MTRLEKLAWRPFSNTIQNRSSVSGFVERVRTANAAGLPRPSPDSADRDAPYFTPEARCAFLSTFTADNEIIRARFRPDLERLFE